MFKTISTKKITRWINFTDGDQLPREYSMVDSEIRVIKCSCTRCTKLWYELKGNFGYPVGTKTVLVQTDEFSEHALNYSIRRVD